MNIFVIGCGRWGSFLAWYLDGAGHNVSLYGRASSANFQSFLAMRQNDYLTLPESVLLTSELSGALEADVIVISVGSQALAGLIGELNALGVTNNTLILCMKGIEIETGRRLSEVASQGLDSSNHVAVWLGPGHVQEFVSGVPNCMVIDSDDEHTKQSLVDAFSGGQIRFYYGNDIIGNEIGAAAKNVIGIAAGMLDGLELSSLKGALMSRGTNEIARLIGAMGGNERSAYGLCHLGDYEATVFSKFSHNRSFGEAFARGDSYTKLAEGYYTVHAIMKLAEKYNVELPICEAVYNILYNKSNVKTEFESLFTRSIKSEF